MAADALKIGRLLDGRVPRNRIYRVGVELEGGWKVLPVGAHLDVDNSVFDRGRPGARHIVPPVAGVVSGEIVSPPMLPIAIAPWIRTHYPSCVDATCGMHIHVSFKSLLNYQRLMIPEFQETSCYYFAKWAEEEGFAKQHPIWTRLAGKNDTCQDKFWPELQVQVDHKHYDKLDAGHRYTKVNFCWNRFETMEFRVLPMMDTPDQAIRAIRHYLMIVNACLVVVARKEKRLRVNLALGEGDLAPYQEYSRKEI